MEGTLAHNVHKIERTSDVTLKHVFPFNKMNLNQTVLAGLHGAGYYWPTVMQATTISLALKGLNIMVQSKSGTGKTLIYVIVCLEKYDSRSNNIQTLVVVPTRELACQVEQILNCIGKHCPKFKAVMVIGGTDHTEDRHRLEGAKAIIGTPGRLLHLVKSKMCNLSQLSLLVVDEVDKLLEDNFRSDMEQILKFTPKGCHTLTCSATFPKKLNLGVLNLPSSTIFISRNAGSSLLVGIRQFVFELPEQLDSMQEIRSKLAALTKIFKSITFGQCVIFTNSQMRADSYCNYLKKDGWHCELLIGSQNQKTRLENFQKLRNFDTRIIVTTDLLARGVDSDHINLVINLEIPKDISTYLHRIGRAGRFGSQGIAINILTPKQRSEFQRLISGFDSELPVYVIPTDNCHQHDFWDFDNYQFSLFERLQEAASKDELKNTALEVSAQSNVNTETYDIVLPKQDSPLKDSNEDAQKVEDVPTFLKANELNGSNPQLTVSNTIDDASSISHDQFTMSAECEKEAECASKCDSADWLACYLNAEPLPPLLPDYSFDQLTEALSWLEELKKILDTQPSLPIRSFMRKYQTPADEIKTESGSVDAVGKEDVCANSSEVTNVDEESAAAKEARAKFVAERKYQILLRQMGDKDIMVARNKDIEDNYESHISNYTSWVKKFKAHVRESWFGKQHLPWFDDVLIAQASYFTYANAIKKALNDHKNLKCQTVSNNVPNNDEVLAEISEKLDTASGDQSNTSLSVEPPTEIDKSTTEGSEALHYPSLVEPVLPMRAIPQVLGNGERMLHDDSEASEFLNGDGSFERAVAISSGFDEGWSTVSSVVQTSQEVNVEEDTEANSRDTTFAPSSESYPLRSSLADSEDLTISFDNPDDLVLEEDTSGNEDDVQAAYDRWYALYATQCNWLQTYVNIATRPAH